VRPTKKVDFTEADGNVEGKIAFLLEKENEKETYKIRDENKWVTVGSNGSVMVKQKWDYEELGPEKTIDFWVTITNTGTGTITKIFTNFTYKSSNYLMSIFSEKMFLHNVLYFN